MFATQDPNADTQWNDVLRAKGIIPPKEDTGITEDDIINMVEQTVNEKSQGEYSPEYIVMCCKIDFKLEFSYFTVAFQI